MNFPKNSVLALLIVFVTGAAAAQDDEKAPTFETGLTAYERGDHETAFANTIVVIMRQQSQI